MADYSSWQEPNRENLNRQDYFYTMVYIDLKFHLVQMSPQTDIWRTRIWSIYCLASLQSCPKLWHERLMEMF